MLDAISSVVSAVAAQSVTAKDEAQTKNTNTASKKQDAKTDKSDAKTAGFSEEAAVYEKSDSKDDSKDTAKSTVNQKMSKADRDALVQALKDDANARQQQLIEKIATIGDSDSIAVGSPAIAIGNALGYGQSVTTGIVSALNRTVTTQDSQTGETVTNNNLIQTDAAINPGNSGGALLNENGEVIGINSVKYSSTDVEGIGYAIPMSVAKPIIESLIQDGKYTNENQAYLGIKGGDVSSEMVAYGFPQGVYVSSVSAGSGAANAGLQEGDIITAVDSTKISSMTELQSALKSYKAGDKVTLTVARQSGRQYEESKVEVTLSSAKDIQQ